MTTLPTSGATAFTYDGQIETVTVGASGYYDITADGAEGGNGANAPGGLGAVVSGDVYLAAGAQLEIVVGGTGFTGGSGSGGGGGGGSFVIETKTGSGSGAVDINELIAGGGGGGGYSGGGGGGQAAPTGGNGGGPGAGAGGKPVSGTPAAGEGAPVFGGGGGGFTGGNAGSPGEAGKVAGANFAGGSGLNGGGGGFGGGGGGGGFVAGGGGGGFGGGGGGNGGGGGGGGGGSLVYAGALQVAETAATNSGNGQVTITAIATPTTIDVGNAAQLDDAIAAVSNAGADNGTAYTIDITTPIVETSTPTVDLTGGDSLTITGAGATIEGASGAVGEAGLALTAGALTIAAGVTVEGGSATGDNLGQGLGVSMTGGALDNAGTILGGAGGPSSSDNGATAVNLTGGVMTNTGTVESGAGGNAAGVYVSGGAELIDSGLIEANPTVNAGNPQNQAVLFGGEGTLVVDPGAQFDGAVEANSTDTLQLAGTGTAPFGGIGTQVTDFGAVQFDAGSQWTLSGGEAGLASIGEISGFTPGETIDVTGVATETGYTLGANNVLTLTGGTASATLNLDPSASYNGDYFYLRSDDAGGTLVTPETAVAPTITGAGGTIDVASGSTTGEPFNGVTVGDANLGADDTLTITLSNASASLAVGSAAAGVTFGGGDGVYTLTGSAANITTELETLELTAPTTLSMTGGDEALTLSLSDVSSADPALTATGSVTAEVAPTASASLAYTGRIETVTIGTSGYYDITAHGAAGGNGTGAPGGLGAVVSGDIYLAAGAQLEIVVGGTGFTGGYGGGGGGGSFVIETKTGSGSGAVDINELIAGGGGGGDFSAGGGGGGQAAPTGGNGYGGGGGAGGKPVSGTPAAGEGGATSYGAGGGGFTGGNAGTPGEGGKVAGATFAGGGGINHSGGGGGGSGFGGGGFGGGGGGGEGGGGGGGFGGGGGGAGAGGGGGGGSLVYAGAIEVARTGGANSGNGLISLTAIATPTTIDVGNAAQLDDAIAAVSNAGADNGTAYTIDITTTTPIVETSTPTVDLTGGDSLTITGAGATIEGASGAVGEAGLALTAGALTIAAGVTVEGGSATGDNLGQGLGVSVTGGALDNAGTILGGAGGPSSSDNGATAVNLTGGVMTNTGTVESGAGGNAAGVYVSGGAELIDSGLIEANPTVNAGNPQNQAVLFGGEGTLVVDPGAQFDGAVEANSTDTLQLAGTGTAPFGGIGTQVTGFGAVQFDAGSQWTLSGDEAGLASIGEISGFTPGETIDVTGVATETGYSLGANNVLTLTGGTASATLNLDPSANYGSTSFLLTGDGAGGTDVQALTSAPSLDYVQGATASVSGGELTIVDNGATTMVADAVDSGTLAATFNNAGQVEVLTASELSGLVATATQQTVTTSQQLFDAIRLVDQASDALQSVGQKASFTISFGGDITLAQQLDAVNLGMGSSLTIDGNDDTLDGAKTYNGMFVYSGDVTIENLTIADARAVGGASGSGYVGGGGGAGLGGGLFVAGSGDPRQAATPDVTLANVSFARDSATGGAGGPGLNSGYSAGGGLEGGAGGSGGGGGVGLSASGATGASGSESGDAGMIPGAPSGGAARPNAGVHPGGASGGGGGDGANNVFSPGGGGVDGEAATVANIAGSGGFGGGGGSDVHGGQGGFGGGGGSGTYGAGGGFGGGGGGGLDESGDGGFGGGSGGRGGGGGLGAGGDVFVQAGATLTIEGGSSLGGATGADPQQVNGGAGAGGSKGGSAFGGGIFLQGNETITLGAGQTVDQTTTVNGVIADQYGSVTASAYASDQGALIIGGRDANGDLGLGTVDLVPVDANGNPLVNTFTGGVTIESGTLVLGSSQAAGAGAITFAAVTDPTVQFTQADAPTNPFVDFGPDDVIDVTDLAFSGATHASSVVLEVGTSDEYLATFTEGGASVELTFQSANPLDVDHFVLSQGASGTDIGTACYVRGTRILTERGEVAVEALAIGDIVVTASGALRPIKWIGTRRYFARFARNNRDAHPICFRAGSLADNAPVRDLRVSPNHAMFLDGVLIPAERLVNGATIVRSLPDDEVHYFHIELESHDVLIADGAASESYLEDDNRGMFHNATSHASLYPGDGHRVAAYCAPRIEDGDAFERVRRRLANRAGLAVAAEIELGGLEGEIERLDADGVSGWARSAALPDAPVCLDVRADGALIGYAYSDHLRSDGRRGFTLRFAPPRDFSGVEVSRSRDGAALAAPRARPVAA